MKAIKYLFGLMTNGERFMLNTKEKDGAIYAGFKPKEEDQLTVGQIVDDYIDGRAGELSENTVKIYRRNRASFFPKLMMIGINDLTAEDVKVAISREEELGKSAKSIKNALNLVKNAVLKVRPDFIF